MCSANPKVATDLIFLGSSKLKDQQTEIWNVRRRNLATEDEWGSCNEQLIPQPQRNLSRLCNEFELYIT